MAAIQTAKSSTNLFTLANTYVDGTNNGNLWGQTINGVWRAYSYDWMNRLKQVDNWASWSEGYSKRLKPLWKLLTVRLRQFLAENLFIVPPNARLRVARAFAALM